MLQGEESLARHITREHGGRQLDDVADGELATIPPPPTTGDATVDRVVSDNWHAIVSRHRIRPVQDIINVRCWNGELQPYQPGVGGNDAWQTLQGDSERWFSFGAQNKRGVALLPRFLKQRPFV